ncbi:aldo/keto reductase [Lactococcus garvieae]|uniref:aldo/keto reductase n=1 Tax=Lactococcus garvieae TaxID=1363 RepID=UPI0009BFCAFF|nr:aldo/keto reductase [Lactococcus garvieae]
MKLNNNIDIPELGLGVFQIPNEDTAEVVKNGILNGYRLIDTAQIYGNEEGTGQGIKEGLRQAKLSRKDIFVTSKLWGSNLSYDETIKSFEASLEKLGLDFLDLYLIHWPGTDYGFEASWKAMEDLYKDGRVKAIGVSNFQKHHLERLFTYAQTVPVLNQIELHPKLAQKELRQFLDAHDIKTQAWSPLMQGQLLDNATIKNIALKHNKSTAQIILRWHLEQGILVNVKSVKVERMLANRDVFDFTLDQEDMKALNQLDENLRVGPDPDTFNF